MPASMNRPTRSPRRTGLPANADVVTMNAIARLARSTKDRSSRNRPRRSSTPRFVARYSPSTRCRRPWSIIRRTYSDAPWTVIPSSSARDRRCVCRSVVTAYRTSIVVASRRSRSSCMGTPNPLIRSSELDMYKAYLKEGFKCGGFRRPSWPDYWHFLIWNVSRWDFADLGPADLPATNGAVCGWFLSRDAPWNFTEPWPGPRPEATPDASGRHPVEMFRYDLGGSGTAAGAGPVSPHVAWTYDTGA